MVVSLLLLIFAAIMFAPKQAEKTASNPEPVETNEAAPIVASHNWSEHKGAIYYYVASVSDNDKNNGQVAGDVVGYKYLGITKDGDYKLGVMGNDKVMIGTAICSNPCTVIHLSTGQSLGFDETSLIGSAFTDAFNNELEEDAKP